MQDEVKTMQQPDCSMTPSRILVVEDEFIVSKEIEMRLAAMGYETVGAVACGERALELVSLHRPDLVLMDIRLQDAMDGITAAEEIRRRFHIPVIFLTAYSEDATLERAKLAEPYGFILKPFEERELKSAIEIALYKHRAESEILRMNRLYDVLSHVGHAIMHANSREELMHAVCRTVVERGAVDLAWVIRFDPSSSNIELVTHYGNESERLNEAWQSVESQPEGRDALRSSLRAGKPFVCRECGEDSCPHPLKAALCDLEFRSCGSFPLSFQGNLWGALNICVAQPDFFRDREIELFKEVAMDISFALDRMDSEARRVRAEESLRQSREDYRSIFENAIVGIYRTSTEGRFLSANPMTARLLGYESPEELLRSVDDVAAQIYASPQDREEASRLMREQGFIKDFEVQCRRKDGTLRWGSLSAYAVRDEEGRVVCVEGTSLDITERKGIEEQLRASEEKFRSVFDNALDGALLTESGGAIFAANKTACAALGYSEEEICQGGRDLVLDQNDPRFNQAQEEVLSTGRFVGELHFRRSDGSTFPAAVSASRFELSNGEQRLSVFFRDVSEQKLSEQLLRESEEKYRNIVTLSSDGIFETDSQGVLTFVNEAHARIYGFEHPEELVGKSIFELVAPADRERLLGTFRGAFSSGVAPEMVELTTVRSDGGLVEIEVRPTLVTKEDGSIVSIGVMRDITERKRMLREERETQEKYRSIFEGALEGIFRTSISGETLVCNPAAARILGYDTPEETLETITKLRRRVWVDQDQHDEYLRRLENENLVSGFESPFYRRDRTKVWLSLDSRAIRGADGRIAFIETLFEDITKRKRDEEIQAARLRLMEYAASHSLKELLQKTLDEAESITESSIGFYHFIEPDQRTISLQACSERTLTQFRQLTHEASHYDLDAAGVWADCVRERRSLVHNDLSALPNRKGLPVGHAQVLRELVVPVFRGEAIVAVLGVGNKATDYDEADVSLVLQLADLTWDIVEHKRAEEQIRHLNDQNELILGAVMEGIIGTNREGNITFINPSGSQNLGYEMHELMGRSLHQTIHHSRHDGTPYAQVDCPMQRTLERGESFAVRDEVLWRKDGTSFPVSYTSAPIRESGKIVGAVVGFRDITELMRASETEAELKAQLNHIQKMEAIGTMAGGIAHDFNNILSPIMGYTEIALDEARGSETLRRHLDQVLIAARRAKDLVGHIMAFSRKGEEESRKPTDISMIIKEALKLLKASLPSTIEIRQHLVNGLVVDANPTQIHQVLVNLCTNAAHAMEDKGVLDISLTTLNLEPSQGGSWLALSGLKAGPHVRLSVSDTGHGMNEETVRRIFEPYFTTKALGKGTGLGLAVVHGIVKSHGGEITVRSEPGRGSVFDVYLPMLAAKPSPLLVASSPLPGGTERVLIVDDEEAIVQMGTTILEQLGYKVTARTSSGDALALFLASPEEFDVVITDLTMPKMTGTELAREIHHVRPDLPVVLCTGFSEKVTASTAKELGISGFALKPLSRKELAELVRTVLNRKQGQAGSLP